MENAASPKHSTLSGGSEHARHIPADAIRDSPRQRMFDRSRRRPSPVAISREFTSAQPPPIGSGRQRNNNDNYSRSIEHEQYISPRRDALRDKEQRSINTNRYEQNDTSTERRPPPAYSSHGAVSAPASSTSMAQLHNEKQIASSKIHETNRVDETNNQTLSGTRHRLGGSVRRIRMPPPKDPPPPRQQPQNSPLQRTGIEQQLDGVDVDASTVISSPAPESALNVRPGGISSNANHRNTLTSRLLHGHPQLKKHETLFETEDGESRDPSDRRHLKSKRAETDITLPLRAPETVHALQDQPGAPLTSSSGDTSILESSRNTTGDAINPHPPTIKAPDANDIDIHSTHTSISQHREHQIDGMIARRFKESDTDDQGRIRPLRHVQRHPRYTGTGTGTAVNVNVNNLDLEEAAEQNILSKKKKYEQRVKTELAKSIRSIRGEIRGEISSAINNIGLVSDDANANEGDERTVPQPSRLTSIVDENIMSSEANTTVGTVGGLTGWSKWASARRQLPGISTGPTPGVGAVTSLIDRGPEVHVVGELEGSIGIGCGGLFQNNDHGASSYSCKWRITYGSRWIVLGGEHEGQSQYCNAISSSDDEMSTIWNHPIDVHFGTSSIQGWPRIEVQLWKLDPYGRTLQAGYGFSHLPLNLGPHTMHISCWRPKGNFIDEVRTFFLGVQPYLDKDAEECVFGRAWEDRHRLVSLPCGEVRLNLNVATRFFS
jgi:hypothetical protein